MARRLDIGVASYGDHDKLKRTLWSIRHYSTTDFRVFVIDNPGPDARTRPLIEHWAAEDHRFIPVLLPENVGYAGAVAKLQEIAETEYLAYCDNDIQILTQGWDEKFCRLLDTHHEVGMVFPGGGAGPIDRGAYTEVMWGTGFCWALSRLCMAKVGLFDTSIGHQNECDYCLRVRMAGWKCAALPDVWVQHEATATGDPKSIERINKGVVDFVNKWNRYFCGANFNYFSPNVMRWDDWPPNALYLEEYWQKKFPNLNANPQVVTDGNFEYDLIKVPRRKDFYRTRII